MNESLIEQVKQHEVLFDVNCLDYRNQHVRQDAWERIARELGIDADAARNGWDRLRRCYINALHRRRNRKDGQPIVKKTRWKYEKQMSFLLPFMDQYRKGPPVQPDSSMKLPLPIDLHRTSLEIKSEVSGFPYQNVPLSQRKDSSCQTNAKSGHSDDKSETDETDMFFMSMSKMAKALPPLEQAKIKLAVSNTVIKSQMKFYEKCAGGSSQSSIVEMECDVDFDPNQV